MFYDQSYGEPYLFLTMLSLLVSFFLLSRLLSVDGSFCLAGGIAIQSQQNTETYIKYKQVGLLAQDYY